MRDSFYQKLSPLYVFLRVNRIIWMRLPAALRNSTFARWYGGILHNLVCRTANRQQFFGTFFLRNRPLPEQICRSIQSQPHGATLRIAVLGCSSGD
jgi:hypothetical protein